MEHGKGNYFPIQKVILTDYQLFIIYKVQIRYKSELKTHSVV
jgi:hypothetical protein